MLRRKIEKKFEIEGRSSMIRDCSGEGKEEWKKYILGSRETVH